ncbi:MAG: ribosome recycling factor [Candidatus Levybacteria bacterium RIFCSPHIGHO2_02_FULL_37_13]|nr:MAG: ribosome recycling factor [Candidatus Levybacteria bacterium RIFCSPHIGHO2_02_FULL_37_13]OGH28966.1 MAG: ribosome recycling factor [Candidatus Levybacteria bacterium RIFCSPHIGHO2_12_FULL_37_9]OGH37385.1 MAG: ribosome recycling factor [Candidatus Levybacteria bacterium RIFCSPLOWO2_01_FULL_37_26]
MDSVVNDTRSKMMRVLEVLMNDLSTIRTGRATPALIENVIISVYNGTTKLKIKELATISASDPQTLVITPFDHSVLADLQKGILEANIRLTPTNDGNVIRISIPLLSQERRLELIHLMKQKLEGGKIMVRQVRHEAMNEIKKQLSDKQLSQDDSTRLEKEVQKTTDDIMLSIEAMGEKKEAELLQI